ncbi:hypothetical protein T484DRAFT_1938402 [Baffinella frigidus]|nr:hypothetical protein T484DRAFT_1938402 [Cryptophyta sp. CCMP2293]
MTTIARGLLLRVLLLAALARAGGYQSGAYPDSSGADAAASGSELGLPVYATVETGSTTAVCVVSNESELLGLRIALLTVLQLQPTMKVQLFVVESVEVSMADELSEMIALLAPDGRVEVIMLDQGLSHHEYGQLLMDERFWLACEGEMVLVFQSDSMLCAGAEFALEAFQDLDYVGAPFYPGGAFPPGHEAHGSLPQGSFDEMAVEALLPIPIGGVGGNGGFSLRRRSKMLQVLRECKEHHPFRTWNEDIFFSYPCAAVAVRFPAENVARSFSVETGHFHAAPFGLHKAWVYQTEGHIAELEGACPELPLLRAAHALGKRHAREPGFDASNSEWRLLAEEVMRLARVSAPLPD